MLPQVAWRSRLEHRRAKLRGVDLLLNCFRILRSKQCDTRNFQRPSVSLNLRKNVHHRRGIDISQKEQPIRRRFALELFECNCRGLDKVQCKRIRFEILL